MKFYKCESCGKILINIGEQNGETGKTEIIPGSVDAAAEKHLPVVTEDKGVYTVNVGSVTHPATAEHHIEWIVLETAKGFQIKYLSDTERPEARFVVTEDKVLSAYAYCNLHGLWKTEL